MIDIPLPMNIKIMYYAPNWAYSSNWAELGFDFVGYEPETKLETKKLASRLDCQQEATEFSRSMRGRRRISSR